MTKEIGEKVENHEYARNQKKSHIKELILVISM
jgi:hypothetical protein